MKLIRRISVFSFAAVLLLSVTVPVARAQQQQSGSGLLISPTRTELSAQPGEQKTFSVSVKNVTQGEVLAKAYLNDFESDNNTGTPKILVDTKNRTPYSLSKMLTGLQDLELKPGESKQVTFKIDVPANVAPGAYFGAVRYAAVPKGQVDGQGQQVALTASVAHLVFVEVPGNVVEQIKVEKLAIQQGDKSGTFFFSKPNKSALSVKNLGNGFSRPFGKVAVQKGSKEVFSYEVNKTDPKGIVLPNSSRTFTDDIKNIKTPGRYNVLASVAYGNGGEVVNYKTSFWYLPVWFVIVVVVLIAALIVGGYLLYRKRFVKTTKRRK